MPKSTPTLKRTSFGGALPSRRHCGRTALNKGGYREYDADAGSGRGMHRERSFAATIRKPWRAGKALTGRGELDTYVSCFRPFMHWALQLGVAGFFRVSWMFE